MAGQLSDHLKSSNKIFEAHLVAVDDSTNFTDVSQVALFVRYCNSNSN